MSRKLAIKKLKELATYWPKGISLFSASGTLLVIESSTNKVLSKINIPNDGGCPNIEIIGKEEYIVWE